MTFDARVITGSGRGKTLGTPTLNVDLSDVPESLEEGVYACFAMVDGVREQGALHYGPRPVFHDSVSCEVHLLDRIVATPPPRLTIEIVQYLREVRDFSSPEALREQIARDIEQTRGILNKP